MKFIVNGYLRDWVSEFISTLRDLLREGLHHKLFRQTGVLLSGDAGARIISLVALALTLRSVGTELFGILVVAETYAKLVDRIFNFQAWTGIINFGAKALQAGNLAALRRYVAVGFGLDVLTSVASFLCAFFLAPFVGNFLKWDSFSIHAIRCYSFLVLFNFTGTAVGILRLTERFNILAWQRIFYASVKLSAVCLCYLLQANFLYFLFAWMLSEVIGYVFIVVSALVVVIRKKWLSSGKNCGSTEFPVTPFVSFVVWTNFSSTIDIPTKFLDMFIVSSLVSFEAAGVYKVFQQVGHVLKKPMEPFYQVVYPHFSNVVAKGHPGKAIWGALRSMFLISLFVGGILIVSVGSSPWWLPAIFGSRFSAFLGDFAIYMVITSFSVVLVTINPLFMALGLVKENFIIQFCANSTFLVFAWFGANLWGLRGVLLAFGANVLISHFSKMIIIARRYGLCRK